MKILYSHHIKHAQACENTKPNSVYMCHDYPLIYIYIMKLGLSWSCWTRLSLEFPCDVTVFVVFPPVSCIASASAGCEHTFALHNAIIPLDTCSLLLLLLLLLMSFGNSSVSSDFLLLDADGENWWSAASSHVIISCWSRGLATDDVRREVGLFVNNGRLGPGLSSQQRTSPAPLIVVVGGEAIPLAFSHQLMLSGDDDIYVVTVLARPLLGGAPVCLYNDWSFWQLEQPVGKIEQLIPISLRSASSVTVCGGSVCVSLKRLNFKICSRRCVCTL